MTALKKRLQAQPRSRIMSTCFTQERGLREQCNKKISRLLIAVDFVFLLLFFSGCYESYSLLLKLGSLVLSFGCFLSVSWNSRTPGWIWGYLSLIALFLFTQYVYTSFKYHQSISQFFFASYYFVFSLLIPVFFYLLNEAGLNKVLTNLELLISVISGYMLLMAFIYITFGVNLTEITRFRGGLLRINAPFIVQLGCVVAAYLFACGKGQKKLHALTWLLSFFAILLVYQSRLIILLLSFIFLYIFALRNRGNAGASYIAVLFALIVFLLLCSIGPLEGILSSFSVTGDHAGSTLTRIYEIEYYLDLFQELPLNGVGLIPFGSAQYSLLSGPFNNFYIDDVGIIGALAEIGLWIFLIYIVPMIVLMFRSFSRKSHIPKLLATAILFYLLGTTFTTLIAFPYFDPTWAFCFALLAFE